MASQSLISTVNGYENYIEKNGIDESVMDAYIEASEVAIKTEKDIPYGLQLTKRCKEIIERFCVEHSGVGIWDLEKYAQDNDEEYPLIDNGIKLLKLKAIMILRALCFIWSGKDITAKGFISQDDTPLK